MTHFEYMEQQGQLTIFDLLDQYEEEMKFKQASTIISKPVDKNSDHTSQGWIYRA